MDFFDSQNQPRASRIITALISRRLRPAFSLFLGPAGDAAKAAALFFAKTCLCPNPQESLAPCQKCSSCLKADKGLHPDIHLINEHYQQIVLNRVSDAAHLKVETMRQVLRQLEIRPFASAYSLAIIEEADTLNIQAQNALLKALEEAPRHVLWIWLASSEDALLPTVVSRASFKIYFRPRTPILAEKRGLSLSRAQVFEISQRVARFRRAAQARKEVSQILEEIKLQLYGQWRREGKASDLLGLKTILQARHDLDLNLTPALVLESALLHLAP